MRPADNGPKVRDFGQQEIVTAISPSSRIRSLHLQQQMRVQIQISELQIHLLFLQEVFKITSGTLEIIIHRMQSFLHMHIQHQETIRST